MTTQTAIRSRGPRGAWAAAHAPAPGVPRWARNAALLIPLAVLPSGIWRIVAVTFGSFGAESGDGDLPAWMPVEVYVLVLSVVSELLAFTAIGLVSTWGEVFPRWVPFVHGRRVPTRAAVVPAALGSILLTALWTWTLVSGLARVDIRGRPMAHDNPLRMDSWEGVVAFAAYAPLVLWGPLLAAVTVAYWRRRRATVLLAD